MSKWITVSTPDNYVTEYGVGYHEVEKHYSPWGGSLAIENDVIYLPPKKVFIISISDTSNMGTIVDPFSDESWDVMLSDNSLWTFDVKFGPSYNYKKDMLEVLPDWVKVGGNWDWMDGD